MSRSQKPRKPYRPKWNSGGVKLRSEPWRVAAVFAPLESMLDAIERDGEVMATRDGTPIFRDLNDGHYYETAPALEGIIDAFHTHAMRQNRPMPLEPLRLLARKLRYAMPLEMADITAVRQAIKVLRAESLEMTLQYANDLIRTTQIRIELDEREAA
ncbi:hypothetical protein [Cupriavidus gilardii]|uniref:hypothetical protein n=1 Tax=Cupriavidus gilardii TaxID=82541 RepID=UPI0021B181D9|nr:hypothetical protein [Cupriavidus gilardii]UXC37149.1 hypothetical protein N4G38_06800 [Cupriavidus gilardii]